MISRFNASRAFDAIGRFNASSGLDVSSVCSLMLR